MNKREVLREHQRSLRAAIRENSPITKRECVYCFDKITAKVQRDNDGACKKCAEDDCNYKLKPRDHQCGGCGRTDGQHEFACRFGTLTYPI